MVLVSSVLADDDPFDCNKFEVTKLLRPDGDLIYTDSLGENDIRIAELKVGEPADAVQCCLKKERLNQSLDFQALSYEWK